MRKTIILLLVAASSVAQAGVKTVNPVNRWMPSGVIEFNWERQGTENGQPYAWTASGTLTFSKDHALFERHTISGGPLRPDKVDPNARVEKVILLAVAPEGCSMHVPGQPTIIYQKDRILDVNTFSILTNGVLPKAVMAAITPESEQPKGNITIHMPGGFRWHITTDDQDRITEASCENDKVKWWWSLGKHVQLADGKWAASEITSAYHAENRDLMDYLQLRFRPGTPAAEELEIPVTEGVKTVEAYMDGAELKTRPMSALTAPSLNKLQSGSWEFHYCASRAWGECTNGWYTSCCQPAFCQSKSYQLLPHCHCLHIDASYMTCDWWWNIVYMTWDCKITEYEIGWCPADPHCYPDGATTEFFSEVVCSVM